MHPLQSLSANTLIEIGLDRLAGDKLAFINVGEDLLHSSAIQLLPKDRVILELLETLTLSDSTVTGIEVLTKAGYTLAFDDFVFEPSQFGFLNKVSLVKIDVLETPSAVLRERVPEIKRYGVKLLAEKVEDKAMHRKCMSWGFVCYQGYYYAKPEAMESRALAPSHQLMLSLLNKLQDPNVSLREVEELITADASLAYRLLQLVNSAALGLKCAVNSVRVAIAMIGMAKIQAIASLLVVSGKDSESRSDLMTMALVRGYMCERIAEMCRCEEPNKHFTAGLFSMLDAMLDLPMVKIVEKVPLDDELREALINPNADSPVARSLHRVLAYERGAWGTASDGLIDPDRLGVFYTEANSWAIALGKAVAAA